MSWEDIGPDSKRYWRDNKKHVVRMFKRPWSLHAWTNFIVEGSGWPLNEMTKRQRMRVQALLAEDGLIVDLDHSPGYYFGHIVSIIIPCLFIISVVGWTLYLL